MITKKVNDTEWSKTKNILSLEFNESSKKFSLHVNTDDILVTLTKDLQKYFGFHIDYFIKGTHYAWGEFKNDTTILKEAQLCLFDLQNMESEVHYLKKSDMKSISYMKSIPYKFYSTLPYYCYERPNFQFEVDVEKSRIKIKAEEYMLPICKKHLMPLLYYRFDKSVAEKIGVNEFHIFNGEKFTKLRGLLQHALNFSELKVTLYFASPRNLGFDREIIESFNVAMDKPAKKPSDMLPTLNSKSATYGYNFAFNKRLQRFQLQVGNRHSIQMSKSLASILGFESSRTLLYTDNMFVRALHFPIFNRNITGLYIYSNIINPVYIGDVRAPLLLTCPFKTDDGKNTVHQLEFLNPTYTSLNRNTILQIDIIIYDDAGTLVPFLFGKTKITLHFRKRT